jgi:hypothetical protein
VPNTGSEHREGPFAALRQAEAVFRHAPTGQSRQAIVTSAVGLLLLGFDTPSLRILAGEDAADTPEVLQYLDATLSELELVRLDDRAVVLGALDSIARDFINGRLDPRAAARLLWETWNPRSWDLDFGPEASKLAVTADYVADLWGEPYAPTVDDLRQAAKAYLDRDTARPAGDMNEG